MKARWLLGVGLTLVASAAILVAFYLLILRPGVEGLAIGVSGREVELLAPRWLGLLALLPLLVLVQTRSLVDLSLGQRILSLGVRALLAVGIVLALARPSTIGFEDRACAVYLVDVSDSLSDDQLRRAREIVEHAVRARGRNEVRLLTFARSPRAVELADPRRAVAIARHPGADEGSQTDIQAAVQHALGLFPPNLLRRVVLVSDGNETEGDGLAEAARAAGRGVKLFAQTLPDRAQKEVLVRSLQIPGEVRMGAPFDLVAEIDSTHKDRATLTLYKDEFINGLDGRKTVDLDPGRNVVHFRSMVREAGYVTYRLEMTGMAHDTFKKNNRATALLPVHGRPSVLYVEGEPMSAGYLQHALEAEKMDVAVRGPGGVPSSPAELQKYDLLILSDVPAMYLGLGQMAAVHAYVRDLGGGFIMMGGQNSFGAGGYFGTRIEKILPVRFDTEKKRDQPSLAMVLCIDRSGSMTGPKIELAKDAAKATAELLGSSDLIGVVAFDSMPYIVVRLQRAANRLGILSDISRLQAGGGTNIRPALEEAFKQLQGAVAKVKHVILLSDGQSSYSGISQLVEQMVASRITVSAVGVGSGADRTLLQMIAERGNGRFYHTDDANNIPKIFTKETTQVARSALVEEPVKVLVSKYASLLAGIDWSRAPALKGYVATKPKPLSETLLVSSHGEPILSMWRVGLGKTAAFTSDVKNRWAVDWLRWPGYGQFFAQLSREIMRHRVQQSFDLRARVERGEVRVVVDAVDRADRFINGLDSSLAVVDPASPERKLSVPLQQTAAGRYQAAFRLQRYGSFLLRATHRADGKVVAESVSSLSVPYPKEYTDLVPDRAFLERFARAGGGALDPAPSQVFAKTGERVRYHRDLWPLLLYAVLGLFLLDVLLRRVRIFGYRVERM
jgi:Ca-activated chloride channel homolog